MNKPIIKSLLFMLLLFPSFFPNIFEYSAYKEEVIDTTQPVGWITFSCMQPGALNTSEIYRIKADGSGLQRNTNNSSNDHSPISSPDGDWITFVSEQDSDPEIYKMYFDGSYLTRLTSTTAVSYGS